MPDPLSTSPEEIVKQGYALGKTPAQIAGKVQQWRGDMLEHGAQRYGDADPAHYAAGVDKLNAHVAGVLGGLRRDAAGQWAQQTFGQQPERLEGFNKALKDGGEAVNDYEPEMESYQQMAADPAFRAPKRNTSWQPLQDANGSEVGRMQMVDRGKQLDALLNYRSGEDGGM